VKPRLRAVTWDRRDLDPQDPHLSALHAALGAPATADELSGEPGALALYRTSSAGRAVAGRRLWRPALLSSLVGTKLLTAFAAGAVGLSGAAVAAYSGVLPDTLQDTAHHTIGAPAAHPSHTPGATPSATPVGPDATGSAAYGLCTAFDRDRAHGKVDEKSVAFRNLATAAGGADKIAAYCATVVKPGSTPSPKASTHPTGKPSSHPTSKPTSHPTGKPTSHATGAPNSHPGAPAPH
jgi:hypothetical protein